MDDVVKTSFRIPSQLHKEVKATATKRQITMQALAIDALQKAVSKKKAK